MEMENDSHALQHPLQLSVFLSPIFLTSGANFQKTQPPPNLSLLISPAGTCQQPGQHTACRKRRERINEGCFRRERFSPRINLSWKRSLYKAPFPLLKGHPALLQEAPCFFLNVLLWDTSLFLPQLYGFIQNKKKWWKKKKKKHAKLAAPSETKIGDFLHVMNLQTHTLTQAFSSSSPILRQLNQGCRSAADTTSHPHFEGWQAPDEHFPICSSTLDQCKCKFILKGR